MATMTPTMPGSRRTLTHSFTQDEITTLMTLASLGLFFVTAGDDKQEIEEGRIIFGIARDSLGSFGRDNWNRMMEKLDKGVKRAFPEAQAVDSDTIKKYLDGRS